MNKFTKAALMVACVALVSQAAHAQFTPGDIDLGFTLNNGGSGNDYVIDLGSASNVGVGGTTVRNLSSLINATTFNTAFSSVSTASASAAGGLVGSTAASFTFVTTTRSGLGTAGTAGSSVPPIPNISNVRSLDNHVPGVPLGTISNTDPTSWTQNILGTLNSQAGSPDPTTALTSGVIYEDLYRTANNATSWIYQGFFTFDFSNTASPLLTFTPAGLVAVPEPATYGAIAGAGLLVLSLRRQIGRKTA